MYQNHKRPAARHSKIPSLGMVAGCTLLLVPIAGFFLGSGPSNLWANGPLLALLLACVGTYFVMRKMNGKPLQSNLMLERQPIRLLTDQRTAEQRQAKI